MMLPICCRFSFLCEGISFSIKRGYAFVMIPAENFRGYKREKFIDLFITCWTI